MTVTPLASIHYLRALAAVAVVESHATQGLLGQAGVDVFFVISGFIMWTVTSRETAPRIFFQRRLIRIVPLYWAATVIMAFHQKATIEAVVKSLCFIPFFGEKGQIWPVLVPGWTLNYEMFFYVLVGATLLLPRRIQLACLIAGLCSLSLSHPFVAWLHDPILLTYTNPLILEFLAGIFIAEGHFRTRLPRPIGGFLLLAAGVGGFWLGPMQDPNDTWRFLFWGVPGFLLVSGMVTLEARGVMFSSALLIALGNASYSLYISHTFVVLPVERALHSFPAVAGVVIAITAACGAALMIYRFVEHPVTQALRRLTDGGWSRVSVVVPRT